MVSKNCKWPGSTNMKAAAACCPNGISKLSWCHLRSRNDVLTVLQLRKRFTRFFPLWRSTWKCQNRFQFHRRTSLTKFTRMRSVSSVPRKTNIEHVKTWHIWHDSLAMSNIEGKRYNCFAWSENSNRLRLRSDSCPNGPNGPHELRNHRNHRNLPCL
jgi:hypothetical protein